MLDRLPSWTIEFAFSPGVLIEIARHRDGLVQAHLQSTELPCALHRLLEFSIPRDRLCGQEGERLYLAVTLNHEREVLERYPIQGVFELLILSLDVEAQVWSV